MPIPRVFIVALTLLPLLARAADDQPSWPEFHGPGRDNIARETGLLKEWPKDGPPLVWSAKGLGHGYASVTIAKGLIFTSGDFDAEEYVVALDMDGKPRWKSPNGLAWRGPQPGARTTPTYSDGLVYQLNGHGILTAFDAPTGKTVWSVNIRERFEGMVRTWGFAENVIVEGDLVLCTPGGVKGRVVALNKKTGDTVWANTDIKDRAAYGSPIIRTHNGARAYINFMRETVVGVDVRTGKLLFSHPHRSTCDQNVTSPLYHEGKVFVTSGHRGGGRMFSLDDTAAVAKEHWFDRNFDNCHGGVILLDGHLYFCGCRLYNKGLICVDLATGKQLYREEPIGKVSLTSAEGLLYCLDNDGDALLVKATPEKAQIVSRFKLPREDKDHSLAHPVICAGRLYIRHLDQMWVYDIKEKK